MAVSTRARGPCPKVDRQTTLIALRTRTGGRTCRNQAPESFRSFSSPPARCERCKESGLAGLTALNPSGVIEVVMRFVSGG